MRIVGNTEPLEPLRRKLEGVPHDILVQLVCGTPQPFLVSRQVFGPHRYWQEGTVVVEEYLPVDGVWASKILEIGGFVMLPFVESVGDYCTCIVSVTTHSLVGNTPTYDIILEKTCEFGCVDS